MQNTPIRKRSTSQKQKNAMSKYLIDEMDLAFADLVLAGWNERLAAFYAYSLSSDNDSSIDTFIKNSRKRRPGIDEYINDSRSSSLDERNERRNSIASRPRQTQLIEGEFDLKTKQGMLDYLIQMSNTPGLDLKSRVDIAKQITDLQQYKREEIKEEDTRIHFYMPLICKKCELYQKSAILQSQSLQNQGE